jgi:transposase
LAAKAKGLGRKLLRDVATLVTPETLLAWHWKLIANQYDGTSRRGPGRPKTADEIETLVVQFAEQNRDWGYGRLQGALFNLGHEIARSTIAEILERKGIEPAPERCRKPRPQDPTRPMVTLKTSWNNVRKKAGVNGRWHDNRHTLITDLAESGAGDQTIRDIAGHVAPRMLKHYSHIRMEAKRAALESFVAKPNPQGPVVEFTQPASPRRRQKRASAA